MQPYTTIQGDTWDTIALAKYGNEKLCHLIMAANPEYLRQDILFFSAGVTLTIPDTGDAEYSEAPSLFEVPEMPEIAQSLQEIIASTNIMTSRRHGDLDGRNTANQHNAAAIVYKDMPLDTALQDMETKMTTKAPVVHHQSTPSTVWTIVHGLGVKKPEYHITGADGVEIVGAINWDEATEQQFVVRFGLAVAGNVEVWP